MWKLWDIWQNGWKCRWIPTLKASNKITKEHPSVNEEEPEKYKDTWKTTADGFVYIPDGNEKCKGSGPIPNSVQTLTQTWSLNFLSWEQWDEGKFWAMQLLCSWSKHNSSYRAPTPFKLLGGITSTSEYSAHVAHYINHPLNYIASFHTLVAQHHFYWNPLWIERTPIISSIAVIKIS